MSQTYGSQPWNNAGPSVNQQPLTEQEMAFDLLYLEKALMANIGSQILEVASQGLRNIMNDCFLQTGQDQLDVFNVMQQNGWYQTKAAQSADVQQAKQKYQQMRGTL